MQAFPLGLRAHPLDRLLQHLPDVDRLPASGACPDSSRDSSSSSVTIWTSRSTSASARARKSCATALVVKGAGLQRLDDRLDGRERCPQFMGDVGYEVATRVLDALRLRDVVEDDQRDPVAAAGYRRRGDLEEASFRPFDAQALPFAGLARLAQGLNDLRLRA